MIITFQDVQTTLMEIQSYSGPASEFRLLVPDVMNDPDGINMALVADAVLARGWFPNGFTQSDGYRIYEYVDSAAQ